MTIYLIYWKKEKVWDDEWFRTKQEAKVYLETQDYNFGVGQDSFKIYAFRNKDLTDVILSNS